MKIRRKIRLGDLLVEHQMISQRQLDATLAEQKKSGRKLGRVLVDNGFIDENSLLSFLSQQLEIPFVDLQTFKLDRETARIIPEMHARRHRALALAQRDRGILVGMADPTDIFAYDELNRVLKKPVELAVVSETRLIGLFDQVYRRTEEISNFAAELGEELSERDIDLGTLAESDNVQDAPVVKLIQSLFEDAVQIGASDIHIEPDEACLRIRQRIDGVLHEHIMEDHRIAPALVLRLKLISGLDISEKRLPQDGRFSVRARDHSIDVRISTLPVQHGESVVMRLLDQTTGLKPLETLGMPLDLRREFDAAIRSPHGMVLVTGPTGSGKTTTLYAALNLLNNASRKIITAEDPVEYRLPRINQVQVNADIGLTFARVLRSVLRQDPDIVLVGEMRDPETVEIGLRAAMTGHLVLSTLHTNDAVSTVSRLHDMGAEGFLVASALNAVVAQRLVRKVCANCIMDTEIKPFQTTWLASYIDDAATVKAKCGRGCGHCNHTGYLGRFGVYELLLIDDSLRAALTAEDLNLFSSRANEKLGRRSLAAACVAAVARGETTLEEAMRISGITTMIDETIAPNSAVHDAAQLPRALST